MNIHFPEGLKRHWQRVVMEISGKPAIDTLTAMYRLELQELHSAERQLCALVDEIGFVVRYAPLAGRLCEYSTMLRMRETEIAKTLAAVGAKFPRRRNETMRALVEKACKTAEQSTENVRDTALMAALQRIIHYMIADYATLASHADALGRKDEAARFSLHAQINQEVDRELSQLTTSTLNIKATRESQH